MVDLDAVIRRARSASVRRDVKCVILTDSGEYPLEPNSTARLAPEELDRLPSVAEKLPGD